MKRSYMIKIIRQKLIGTAITGPPINVLSPEFPEQILMFMEHLGMQPPVRMKPIPFESNGKQYPLIPGDFKNEEGIYCTPGSFGWEPEDNNED